MHFYRSPTGLEVNKSLESHDPNKSSPRLPMLGNIAQTVLMFYYLIKLPAKMKRF